jgi:hypothetical protein
MNNSIDSQVISKKRVSDHGEVFTSKKIVNEMLDMVKHETERIDSKFLEPACGTGNFLIEILSRKLALVGERYSKSQFEYERHSVIAISSIYGIDILEDNISECINRLYKYFDNCYSALYGNTAKDSCRDSVKFILKQNILHGDALTLKTKDSSGNLKPIIFAEWSGVNGSMFKRRDFVFAHLIDQSSHREMPLFSDLDEEAYIPEPVKDYPLAHFLELGLKQ